MLWSSLIASTLLLVAVNWAAASKHPIRITLGWGVGFCFLPFFLTCFLPAVTLQAVFLVVAFVLWGLLGQRPGHFVYLSGLATLAAYAVIVGGHVWGEQQEYAWLRKQYAYQSMETRLPPPRVISARRELPEPKFRDLVRLEEKIGDQDKSRAAGLRHLHEETVTTFVNSPGFGVTRTVRSQAMWFQPSERSPLANPGDRVILDVSPGDLASTRYTGEQGGLQGLHEDSVADFVYPEGFGYLKDREHVAGFLGHRFSMVPKAERWRVRSIDLVSLVLHDPPVAYVSRLLPRMEELRQAPTRPLDVFESTGLTRLQTGEDLCLHGTDAGVRMLGAIRALRQCVDCHGCERGDLLGAFSYTVRKE